MSVVDKWDSYHCTVRWLSILFGFILIFGLSENRYIVSFMVAMGCIALTSVEARILIKVRNLADENQWSGALWVLLTGCLAYVAADRLWVRIVLLCLIGLSHYIHLYTICYSEKLTLSYVKKLLWDIPILVMAFPIDLFERQDILEKKMKNQSRFVGICVLLVILMCIVLPFYITADARIYSILAALSAGVASGIPVLGICVFLGFLPAMVNYSITKGLCFDIVLRNPERQTTVNTVGRNYFINMVTIKIVIIGLAIANAVFLALQVEQLIRCCIQSEMVGILGDVHRIFPVLVCVGLNVIFLLLSYLTGTDTGKARDKCLKNIFILSVLGNVILVLVRYIIKIISFGINASDLVGCGITVIYLIIIFVGWRCIVQYKGEFVHKIAVWGVALLSIFHIMPTEYLVSQINVIVFMDKYERGLIGESVVEKDIDLEFLSTMGLEAVPAMTDLLDVEILYEGSGMTLGEVAEDHIIEMFYKDLSPRERDTIRSATGERLEMLLEILGKKIEYQIVGKRRLAYEALRGAIGADY